MSKDQNTDKDLQQDNVAQEYHKNSFQPGKKKGNKDRDFKKRRNKSKFDRFR